MPVGWQTNFINSGQSSTSTSIEALRTYMVQQELVQTDAHCEKTREVNIRNQNSSKTKSYPKSTRQSSSKGAKRNGTSYSTSRDITKRSKKLDNDDDCPIHGPLMI